MLWTIFRGVRWIIPFIPKFIRGKINDPKGYKRYTPGSFAISLNAFNRLQELAVLARESAHEISLPVLILSSPNDEIASFAITKELFDSKLNALLLEYPKSNHILLYDFDSKIIIENILEFLTNDKFLFQ